MTDGKVRKYRAAKKSLGRTEWTSVLKRRWQYTQHKKTRKRQERTERNVKKDRVDRTEYQFHKSLE